MTELPANLVIRRVAPRRKLILTIVAVIAGALALGVTYELGRYDGGYDVLAAARQRSQLESTAARLERANSELRRQLAELDTLQVGRAQERAELARSIGELRSQVASQAQQLALYRGVVSHGVSRDDAAIGLKIQQLTITADSSGSEGSAATVGGSAVSGGAAASDRAAVLSRAAAAGGARDSAGRFQVHLTLLQTANPRAALSGTLQLSVEGRVQGKAETLDLAALTAGKRSALSFSVRYYQSLEQDILFPSGFSPERLTVEVRAGRKPVTPLIQTFAWKVDAP